MRRTTKSFSPVLLHSKFKQTKVKTKIINGSPAPVYKGLEAIECLRQLLKMQPVLKNPKNISFSYVNFVYLCCAILRQTNSITTLEIISRKVGKGSYVCLLHNIIVRDPKIKHVYAKFLF